MQYCLNTEGLLSELRILLIFCCSRIFCFQRHFYLLRLNLTSSTNIELSTALCNAGQID